MSGDNVATARDTYDAFNRGDIPAVLGVMADDIEWLEAEGLRYGGVYRSPQEILDNVFSNVAQDADGFAVTPERYIESGDCLVVLGRYSGTGKETGRAFDVAFGHVWDFRDGKLQRFQQLTDTALFNEAIPNQKLAHA